MFMPRKGYEKYRVFQLNPALVRTAYRISAGTALQDSDSAQRYRQRYPEPAARKAPSVHIGTHMTGDTFFHGPGLSKEAQYIAKLYGADDYVATEMEAAAIALVIQRLHGTDRILSLRGSVNFDQGNPNETTQAHLDPKPGETAGGAETVANVAKVGGAWVDTVGHVRAGLAEEQALREIGAAGEFAQHQPDKPPAGQRGEREQAAGKQRVVRVLIADLRHGGDKFLSGVLLDAHAHFSLSGMC